MGLSGRTTAAPNRGAHFNAYRFARPDRDSNSAADPNPNPAACSYFLVNPNSPNSQRPTDATATASYGDSSAGFQRAHFGRGSGHRRAVARRADAQPRPFPIPDAH